MNTEKTEFDTKQIIDQLTDDQCLELVQALFQDRVMCGSSFLQDKTSGLITHSIIVLKLAGDEEEVWSDPQELAIPLMMINENKDSIIAYTKDENDPTVH